MGKFLIPIEFVFLAIAMTCYLWHRQNQERRRIEISIKQQTQRERFINQITQHIRQSLNLETVLNTTVAEVKTLLQVDRVLIYRIWQDGTGSAITESVNANYPSILGRTFSDEVFPVEYHQAYTKGKVRAINDIDQDDIEICLADFVKQFGVKSKLVVPILQHNRASSLDNESEFPYLWGLLITHQCAFTRPWQPWEVELMKQLANQVAIAIQQSELYEQLQLALEREKELSRLKTRFFSMASHEFRTPLSTALAAAQLLENSEVAWLDPDKRSRNLHRIQNSVKNMVQLLDDILIINRAEAGKLEFNPNWLDLKLLFQQFIEEIQLSVSDQYYFDFICSAQDTKALVDERLVRSILSNLLSNAIKYSPGGGQIKIALSLDSEQIIFEVTDQGIGISPEDQKQIFEPFHRGKNVRNITGTGLGLMVAKKCVDLHSGSILLKSAVDQGTTVTICLKRYNHLPRA
nr:miniaturized light-sensing histidine kinase CcaSm10 [Integration vector]